MKQLILVALGGGIGAGLRFATNLWALRVLGAAFPWGTLVVNVLGSFFMGLLAVLFARKFGLSDEWRLFLMTGLLGGYTTFSAFSLDAMKLIENGALQSASLYIGANVIGSILALLLGLFIARNFLTVL